MCHINEVKTTTLVDSGANVTTVSYNGHANDNSPDLWIGNIKLSGFDGMVDYGLGSFTCEVQAKMGKSKVYARFIPPDALQEECIL